MIMGSRGKRKNYLDHLGSPLRVSANQLQDDAQELGHLQNMGTVQRATEGRPDGTVDFKQWNIHTLSGKYHTFHIKNKYPIPGAAIADDYHRNQQIEDTTKVLERLRDEDNIINKKVDSKVQVHELMEQSMAQPKWSFVAEDVEQVLKDRQKRYEEFTGRTVDFIGEATLIKKLFTLIKDRQVEKIKSMLMKGDLNVNMCDERMHTTMLMQACSAGLLPLVEIFLQYGADPNLVNISGNSALHFCWDSWLRINPYLPRKKYQYKLVCKLTQILASYGADPNIQQCDGWTPLHFAAMYGHEEIILILLREGADVSAVDVQGNNPADLAASLVERGFGDPKKREAAIGLLRNWNAIEKEKYLRNFRASWQLTLDKNTRNIKRAIDTSWKVTQVGSPPKAGSIDLLSREGAGGPVFSAHREAEERMWGESTDIASMFKSLELERKLRGFNKKETLHSSEYDKKLDTLPSADERQHEQQSREVLSFDITSSSPSKNASKLKNTAEEKDETNEGAEVRRRRARTQWIEHCQSAAPSTAELVRKQANEAASMLANTNKVVNAVTLASEQTDEQIMKKVNLMRETDDAMENHHQKRQNEIKQRLSKEDEQLDSISIEKDRKVPKSLRPAFAAVRNMSKRLKKGAKEILEDAHGSEMSKNIMETPTGEVYHRRKVMNSALMKPSRLRCDNRTKVGTELEPVAGSIPGPTPAARERVKKARQEKLATEQAVEVDGASTRPIPPTHNMRRAKETTAADAINADSLSSMVSAYSSEHKKMMDGAFKKSTGDSRILPKEGDQTIQQQKKKAEERTSSIQSISQNATYMSKRPVAQEKKEEKQAHSPKLVPPELKDPLYGDERAFERDVSQLSTVSLHDRGGIKLGEGQSLVELSKFDSIELTSLNRPVVTKHYGKEFNQKRYKQKNVNHYNLVHKPKHKVPTVFGDIEEPWQFDAFNAQMTNI